MNSQDKAVDWTATKFAQGASATTPAQIARLRLASVRGMLRCEKAGMKTRGGALRPRLAKEFGLKARDSYDVYIARCEELMQEAFPV